jgi:hypothetical protein
MQALIGCHQYPFTQLLDESFIGNAIGFASRNQDKEFVNSTHLVALDISSSFLRPELCHLLHIDPKKCTHSDRDNPRRCMRYVVRVRDFGRVRNSCVLLIQVFCFVILWSKHKRLSYISGKHIDVESDCRDQDCAFSAT